jgi:Na+/H+-dicarboxylate symporter
VVLHALVGLWLGVGLGWLIPGAALLSRGLQVLSEVYGTVAPLLLYCVLAPSLLKMVRHWNRASARFWLHTAGFFASARLVACVLAIAVVSLSYGLPLVRPGEEGGETGGASPFEVLGQMMVESPYFLAVYAAVFTAWILRKREGWLVQRFIGLPELVESFGHLLTRVTPAFTFLMGLYIVTLPDALWETFQRHAGAMTGSVSVLGIRLEARSSTSIFQTYLAVSLLTGAVCLGWHLLLLLYVKLQLQGFSLRRYVSSYLARIYPLLWCTCSEALAMPLNLHLIRTHYPQVQDVVRQFTIGAGSVLSTNGTLMCCFVVIPAASGLLGHAVGVVDLLLCLPVIYIIGFGVPGIPGELILFAGPIMGMMSIPPDKQSLFLMTFIGLQVGLPDSFRTGANSTEGCPAALLLSSILPVGPPRPVSDFPPATGPG